MADSNVIMVGTCPSGSKSVFSGRLLEKIFPNYWKKAPTEREVKEEVLGPLYRNREIKAKLSTDPGVKSFILLRAKFDKWLSDKIEGTEAEVISSMKVKSPPIRDGKAKGIVAEDGEEIESHIIIAADEVVSSMDEKSKLRPKLSEEDFAVRSKEVIEISKSVIEGRFELGSDERVAQLSIRDLAQGTNGGGFLYTNLGGISLGVIIKVSLLVKKANYTDAAGFCANYGIIVRSIDFTIENAIAAAKAVDYALSENGISAPPLRKYSIFPRGRILRDLKRANNVTNLMESFILHKIILKMAVKTLEHLFKINGKLKSCLYSTLKKELSEENTPLFPLSYQGGDQLEVCR